MFSHFCNTAHYLINNTPIWVQTLIEVTVSLWTAKNVTSWHLPFQGSDTLWNSRNSYCQSYSHRSPQCLFKRLAIPPPCTCTTTEALAHHSYLPKWCGKCLCNDLGHEEVDCPTREVCGNCGHRGNLYFLRTHKCNNEKDQLMHGEENNEGDPELYGDGKS